MKPIKKKDDIDIPEILEPDKNNLEVEWVKQPGLARRYSLMLADAQRKLDMATALEKAEKARIDLLVRTNPGNYMPGVKVTETSITNAVLRSPELKKATKARIKAQHKVNVLFAIVNQVSQRKTALENLVKLHGMGYFGTPTVSGEDNARMKEVERRHIRNRGISKKRQQQ